MRKMVWMITGCSKGLGKLLAQELLVHGQRVIATARHVESIANLGNSTNQELLMLTLDVTRNSDIKRVVRLGTKYFGSIDVLVNNAGYGYYGTQEEADIKEVRKMFDTNVFGFAQVTQAVLPIMREQRHGTIVNISSIGGLIPLPCRGFYHASKFAVEALSEVLYYEVCEFGIRVIVIEPGGHDTEFSRSAVRSQYLKNIQSPYTTLINRWEAIFKKMVPIKGNPLGVVNAIIDAVGRDVPFQRVQVGEDAKIIVSLKESSRSELDFLLKMHEIYGLGLEEQNPAIETNKLAVSGRSTAGASSAEKDEPTIKEKSE